MLVATLTFYEPNGEARDTFVTGIDLEQINIKIDEVKRFVQNRGFRFLSSVIQEVHGMIDEDVFLLDFANKEDKIFH